MLSDEELLEKAKEASENAYCPYSEFPVGACILYKSSKIFKGCNIENASYGLSLCAERNAMSSAISSGETSGIEKIAIYSPKSPKCFPCGACRQWLQELSKGENVKIVLENDDGSTCYYYINDIFPYSFKLI